MRCSAGDRKVCAEERRMTEGTMPSSEQPESHRMSAEIIKSHKKSQKVTKGSLRIEKVIKGSLRTEKVSKCSLQVLRECVNMITQKTAVSAAVFICVYGTVLVTALLKEGCRTRVSFSRCRSFHARAVWRSPDRRRSCGRPLRHGLPDPFHKHGRPCAHRYRLFR